ncbi:MAG: J domain-containing protein [Chloroflexi bacterium]|nr:J domain-containing protein [Chloroflexota bacterium]
MKQFVLDHITEQYNQPKQEAKPHFERDEADIYLELAAGKTVAVYIINRAVRVPEIKARYEENTANEIHTLFIVDGRTLPENQTEIEPPHWLSALHTLTHSRVYAYWVEDRSVTIRPIHMEWKWGTAPRKVEYGPVVDVRNIRPQMISVASKYITGSYATVDLGEGTFWKKHEPIDDRTYKYSWRQWNYSTKRTYADPDNHEDQTWDPEEEFERHYGGVGGYDQYARTYSNQQRRQRSRPPQRQSSPAESKYYALLGVPSTATFEEIKRAYRRKAMENHPDLHPENKEVYTAKMADINEAFKALSEKVKATPIN